MKDKPIQKCPECGKKVERVISGGSGVLFKGSGFYQTDYRKPSYRQAEKKDKPAAAPDSAAKKETSETTKKKKADS